MRVRSPVRWGMTLALLLAVCGGLAAADKPGASSELIPLEHFTRNDSFGTIKISPDGTTIAATGGSAGRSGLMFLDLDTRKVVTTLNTGSRAEIDDFHWVSNTRVLYTVRTRYNGYQFQRRRDIVGINKDGRRQTLLYGNESKESRT